jgi:RNA polymerase sigma-70 factor, ECF subfamily
LGFKLEKVDLEEEFLLLIHNFKKGDQNSYRILLTKLGKITDRFLYAKIQNPEEREECVQDILMAIHSSLPNFDASKKFLPWYFSIVRFKTIDRLKKIYKEKSITKENIEDFGNLFSPYTEYNSGESEDSELLESAMSSLDPLHRKALVLSKIEGIPLKEIALELEWTLSKTKVVIHRSIAKLKQFMEAADEEK